MPINYIQSVKKLFEYYKSLGEKTFDQLEEPDLFWQYNPESNSIAIIVNHLWGNMKSRWTDFLHSDGEKTWRNRDQEFEPLITTKADMMNKWNDGFTCLFNALDAITEESFSNTVYIRNQAHAIPEAINRQLAHYASHIGQIIYIGRMIKGSAWKSLSIPKGASSQFNKDKVAKGKHGGHFTEDIK